MNVEWTFCTKPEYVREIQTIVYKYLGIRFLSNPAKFMHYDTILIILGSDGSADEWHKFQSEIRTLIEPKLPPKIGNIHIG